MGSGQPAPGVPVPQVPAEIPDYFKGDKLMKKDGILVDAEPVLQGKIIGIYFSAHWCPPCRQFTPILRDFHAELKEAGADFEIVFASADHTEKDLKKYMEEAHGDWYALPHGSGKYSEFAKKWGISGIPCLVIVKPDGSLVTKNGRGDVGGKKSPKMVLERWKK